jgi:uncharacterized membrane protein
MQGLLSNFRNTMIVSFILAIIMVAGYMSHYGSADAIFWQAVFRWLHTFFGILWIGLLYYFNFVQIRKMPDIPAELKPAVSKYIAPEALFWFRYAALATWIMGVILAFNRGYLVQAFTLGALDGFSVPQHTFIGVGMCLAEPEDRPGPGRRRRRRQGQGRQAGHAVLAHQHAAVGADAGHHDHEPDHLRLTAKAV